MRLLHDDKRGLRRLRRQGREAWVVAVGGRLSNGPRDGHGAPTLRARRTSQKVVTLHEAGRDGHSKGRSVIRRDLDLLAANDTHWHRDLNEPAHLLTLQR